MMIFRNNSYEFGKNEDWDKGLDFEKINYKTVHYKYCQMKASNTLFEEDISCSNDKGKNKRERILKLYTVRLRDMHNAQ